MVVCSMQETKILKVSTNFKAKSSLNHGRLPRDVPIPDIVYIHTLEEKRHVSLLKRKKAINSPSISKVRPTVCFHVFPALAILRNRLSASTVFRSSGSTAA